jgi:hypothetical protein
MISTAESSTAEVAAVSLRVMTGRRASALMVSRRVSMPMAVTWRVYSPGGHPRNGKESFGVGEGAFIRGQEANDGAYDGVALLV